jgi:RND family efflux transporter MFP subunit
MSPAYRALYLTLAVSLLAGCATPAETPAPEPVAEVSTTKAVTGDLPVVFTGFGSVEFDPAGQRSLTAEIEARVLELRALPGDAVAKGDAVLRLGPSSGAGVELATSRRDALAAEAAAARARRLRDDGLASDADVETATVVAQNLAALADSLTARAGSIATLRSPIDGIVDAVFVEAGDLVVPGTTLARLASPGAIQARIGVEIEDAALLSPGDAVSLRGLDNSAATFESEIRIIDYRVDPTTRMASTLVPILPDRGLLPGEAVRAEMTAEVRPGIVHVPRRSVFADEAGSYLFVVRHARAVLERVQVGLTANERTEIVEGVAAGETVVVEGAAILADGMRVREAATGAEAQP